MIVLRQREGCPEETLKLYSKAGEIKKRLAKLEQRAMQKARATDEGYAYANDTVLGIGKGIYEDVRARLKKSKALKEIRRAKNK